jgi:P-type Cu2+ transporter
MVETLDLSLFVEPGDAGASHMTLAVEGVSCAGCIRKIENGLNKLPGVIDARLNFTQRRLAVDWRNDETDAAKIIAAIETIGYHAHPFAPERADADESAQAKWLMKCLAVAGFAAMNVMLLSVSVWAGNVSDMTQETRDLFHWLSALIALPAAAYAGQPFFQSAFRALRGRHVNMDVPISIGVTLALGLSVYETAIHATHAYFDSAIMLLFFLLVGRYLDLAMRRKTRLFAGNLASIKAEFAHRLDASGELVRVPAAALYPGDRVLVRAGERVSADGAVLNGASEIDESLVTGETLAALPVRDMLGFIFGVNRGEIAIQFRRQDDRSCFDGLELRCHSRPDQSDHKRCRSRRPSTRYEGQEVHQEGSGDHYAAVLMVERRARSK